MKKHCRDASAPSGGGRSVVLWIARWGFGSTAVPPPAHQPRNRLGLGPGGREKGEKKEPAGLRSGAVLAGVSVPSRICAVGAVGAVGQEARPAPRQRQQATGSELGIAACPCCIPLRGLPRSAKMPWTARNGPFLTSCSHPLPPADPLHRQWPIQGPSRWPRLRQFLERPVREEEHAQTRADLEDIKAFHGCRDAHTITGFGCCG